MPPTTPMRNARNRATTLIYFNKLDVFQKKNVTLCADKCNKSYDTVRKTIDNIIFGD